MTLQAFRTQSASTRLFRSFSGIEQRIAIATLAIGLLFVGVDAARAHEFKIGAIEVEHPWSRATPPGAKVGGGYLVIANDGDSDDTLVSATFESAGRTEIHQMSVDNGVMKMRPVEGGVAVPAHGKAELAPNGFHLMFMDLKQPLKQGESVKGTLTFAKAGTVDVVFEIDAIGAMSKHEHGGDGEMSGMKMEN